MPPAFAARADALRAQYDVERELAARLRAAPPEERAALYGTIYDELFRRLPEHAQMCADPTRAATRERTVERRVRLLRRFCRPESVLLEIGAGDCRLSLAMAPHVRTVYAVDVSPTVMAPGAAAANVECTVTPDGCRIPVPPASVDVAFSDQLIEHLHPDDVPAHLASVRAALRPGGCYICITPSALRGPFDVSRWFDDVAAGMHLHEYTTAELAALCRSAGFTRVRACLTPRGVSVPFPLAPIRALERGLQRLPLRVRRTVADWRPVRLLLGVQLIASK